MFELKPILRAIGPSILSRMIDIDTAKIPRFDEISMGQKKRLRQPAPAIAAEEIVIIFGKLIFDLDFCMVSAPWQ
jgi:hypothetical protein